MRTRIARFDTCSAVLTRDVQSRRRSWLTKLGLPPRRREVGGCLIDATASREEYELAGPRDERRQTLHRLPDSYRFIGREQTAPLAAIA